MREIQSYEYVVMPYSRVREALRRDPRAYLTGAFSAKAGPLDLGVEIAVEVAAVEEIVHPVGDRRTRVDFQVSAARNPGLFPVLEATLEVYPLSSMETQLDLHGRYWPPGGIAGRAADAAIGHHIAEGAIARFLEDIRERLARA